MMFSFHKPKVYRSPTGCCICKAKSSSSRFTDSKKYEEDFIECFKLPTPRQGEICNACVLLVKRWKKLPVGSNRNWHHVVDARAGPGIKSMTKFKAKNKKLLEQKRAASSTEVNMEELDDNSMSPEAERSSGLNDLEYVAAVALSSRRRRMYKARRREDVEDRDHVDPRYWSSVILCCGTVYRGPCNEIMIDPNQIKPCGNQTATCAALQAQLLKQSPHQAAGEAPAEKDKTTDSAASSKSFSDTSSDSGYDDSSNQGALIVGAEEVAKAD